MSGSSEGIHTVVSNINDAKLADERPVADKEDSAKNIIIRSDEQSLEGTTPHKTSKVWQRIKEKVSRGSLGLSFINGSHW